MAKWLAQKGRHRVRERHDQILSLLKNEGVASIQALAVQFQCSPATIRRDIQLLTDEVGELRRYHGAIALEGPVLERRFQEKMSVAMEEKAIIADAVVRLIPDEAVVGLNGGTTTTLVARKLAQLNRSVTVVTNAINIAYELTNSGVPVVVIGGSLRPSNFETTGPVALRTLQDLHLDWAILGANGVHPRFGISTSAEQEAAISRGLGQCADNVGIVVDHTKFNQRALHRMMEWAEVQWLIGDPEASGLVTDWGPWLVKVASPAAEDSSGRTACVWEVNPGDVAPALRTGH